MLWPEVLIDAFLEEGEPARDEIVAIGAVLLALAALFQLVDGPQVIALGLLRGAQDATVPMWAAAFSYWVIGAPSAYVFGIVWGYGGAGVWMGLVLGLACAAGSLSWRFWRVIVPKVGG